MIGDKLVITDYHRKSAALIFNTFKASLSEDITPVAFTVAGESGCGKSETASVLADLCSEAGYRPVILQQDDYFIYPPETNHNKRVESLNWVGPQEVRLDLIDSNIAEIKQGDLDYITKPLVIFDENRITGEKVEVKGVRVIVVEGTYTTTLANADFKAFIDRDYRQTRKARLKRSRDPATSFLEKVLAIEHEIISRHKKLAHIVIPPPEDEAVK